MGLFSRKKPSDADAASPPAEANGRTEADAAAPVAHDGNGDEKTIKKKDRRSAEEIEVEKRDLKKARRFFEYAKTVADSRNFDYAIECYINGLRHDPESMTAHDALYDVAKRRKVAEGKPGSMRDQFKHSGGKTAIERMLNAEFLWAKDFTNPTLAITVMENANKAELWEVAYWIGEIGLYYAERQKRPNKILFLKLRDQFQIIETFEAYGKAVEACELALRMSPGDLALQKELSDLQTEQTIKKSGVGSEGVGVKEVAKDFEHQQRIERENAIAGSADQVTRMLDDLRKAYEAKPEDIDLLRKFINALVNTDLPEYENQALVYLQKALDTFGQYRFKVQMGDIRIKQYKRLVRELRAAHQRAEDDAQRGVIVEQLKQVAAEQMSFELAEYTERVKKYPTDLGLKFDLGVRHFAMGHYDEAITCFQDAQNEPKKRAWALRYLGDAFARKDWLDEAIDTFYRGMDVHPYSDDRLALELRHELTKILHQKAVKTRSIETAEEGAKVASQIAQIDFNYKDIREWVDKFRKLLEELRGKTG